jgi:nitrogen fixation NifU-like protein
MSELRDLYQETILDHGKRPRNHRAQDEHADRAQGHNPLCGDRMTVYVRTDGETITDVSFEGSGCAISTASASMMTEALRGKSVGEARELFRRFHQLLAAEGDDTGIGKLEVFKGVREFPMRVKCATLAWHTLQAALESNDAEVTTE